MGLNLPVNHKWFTPIIMFEIQVNAEHIEHVCSFILGVFY